MQNNKTLIDNINIIISQYYSNNKTKIDLKKLKKYILKRYNIVVDDNLMSDILSNNPFVESIDEKSITLGTKKQKDDENLEDDIHDTAVDQASQNLKTESIVDNLVKYKVGMEINSNKVHLDENDEYYHLHQGALKAKRNYIIDKIISNKLLQETKVRCKISGSRLHIEFPIKNIE